MAIPVSFVADGNFSGGDADTFTSDSFNSTGYNLLIVGLGEGSTGAGTAVITDSKSNTLVQAVEDVGNGRASSIWYATNPTVGTGHTVTATGTDFFGAAIYIGWDVANTTSPLDQVNSHGELFSSTIQPGSVTPSAVGDLIIAVATHDGGQGTPTIGSGFTILDGTTVSGFGHHFTAVAYLIATSTSAVNPTFTYGGGVTVSACIATFKVGGGAAGLIKPPYIVSRPSVQRAAVR